MDFGTTKGNQFRWATLSFGGSQRLPLQKSSRLGEMILTNARLIFPDGIRDGLEVVVEGGKIAEIRPPAPRLRRTDEQTRTSSKDVVDLDGNYLAPGFIDLHVHAEALAQAGESRRFS